MKKYAAFAALALTALPAHAVTGLEVKIATKAAQFIYNFLSAASSNATAVAIPVAVSISQGEVTDTFTDTGFFYAEVTGTIKSGVGAPPPGDARQFYRAYAKYNFVADNVHVHANKDPELTAPDGIFGKANEDTKIKGVLGVLKEAIIGPPPMVVGAAAGPLMGDMFIPVAFETYLGPRTGFSFKVSVVSDTESWVVVAGSGLGNGKSSLSLPSLLSVDPGLADLVADDFKKRIKDGKGSTVSFVLGDGLLPSGDSGGPGIPFAIALDTPFWIESELTSFNSGALPEPATWLCMLSGFGIIGLRLRRAQQGEAVAARA